MSSWKFDEEEIEEMPEELTDEQIECLAEQFVYIFAVFGQFLHLEEDRI